MSRPTSLPIVTALVSALGLVVVWILAFHVGPAITADLRVEQSLAVRVPWGSHRAEALNAFSVLCNPAPYAALCCVVLAVAAFARGPRVALILAGVLIAPNVVTQYLKTALAAVRPGSTWVSGVDIASWPSGHATASMTLAGCAVIAAPSLLRPLVAGAGLVFTLLMGLTVVALAWHYPSDVLGGYFMGGMFLSAGLACLRDAPAVSAARLPQRLFGAVGPPRENEQQV